MKKVFFLPWESRARLAEFLIAAGIENAIRKNDLTAVKMHFGEKGNDGYIKPDHVRPVLKILNNIKARPFLTDSGTIYHGRRSNAVSHLSLAAEHGFSQTRLHVPIVIADGVRGMDFGEVEIPGKHFKKVKIAGAIRDSDSVVLLSHFKGHMLSGFGGAIKNLGMGCGSRLGKFEMHSSISPEVKIENCTGCGRCKLVCSHGAIEITGGKVILDVKMCVGCGECIVNCSSKALTLAWEKGGAEVQERFAEYALGAIKGKRIFCVNFINHVTKNCDCMSSGETPLLPDIGIMASEDPVALDAASLDIVIEKAENVFAREHPDVDSTVQLEHARRIGLGERKYELVKV